MIGKRLKAKQRRELTSYNGTIAYMKWVKLCKYCEISGDTKDAVNAKRRNGIWAEGKQWRKAPDNKIWINIEAIDKWVENSQVNVE